MSNSFLSFHTFFSLSACRIWYFWLFPSSKNALPPWLTEQCSLGSLSHSWAVHSISLLGSCFSVHRLNDIVWRNSTCYWIVSWQCRNRNIIPFSPIWCLEDRMNSSFCFSHLEVKKCIPEHYSLFEKNQIRTILWIFSAGCFLFFLILLFFYIIIGV